MTNNKMTPMTKGLYPENLFDLKVKISFGMGTPAARPWISVLGPGKSMSNPSSLFSCKIRYYEKKSTHLTHFA